MTVTGIGPSYLWFGFTRETDARLRVTGAVFPPIFFHRQHR
ncbi:MAG: hypothetical protein V7606_4728 [Burkholderiales bacterium]